MYSSLMDDDVTHKYLMAVVRERRGLTEVILIRRAPASFILFCHFFQVCEEVSLCIDS